jgi:hypothetical protein
MLLRAGFLTIALAVNNLTLNTRSVFAADAGDSCCRDLVWGQDLVAQYRRPADYVARILKGEKPADLPVQTPTKS